MLEFVAHLKEAGSAGKFGVVLRPHTPGQRRARHASGQGQSIAVSAVGGIEEAARVDQQFVLVDRPQGFLAR